MGEDVSKALQELRAFIEEAIKSGRFPDEDAGFVRALELLREDEKDSATRRPKRRGGQWKGQVTIAPDFDDLPDDLAESFGNQ